MTYGLVASVLILLTIWKGKWGLKKIARHILEVEFRQIHQERILSRQLIHNQKQEIVYLKLNCYRLERRLESETLRLNQKERR